MTTSSSACGARPSTRSNGLSSSSVSQLPPNDGRTHVGVADRLAVVVDELGVGLDVALGRGDAVDLRDRVDAAMASSRGRWSPSHSLSRAASPRT